MGYKGTEIKKYFINYPWLNNNTLKINFGKPIAPKPEESWNITLSNTGLNTLTQKRLYLIRNHIRSKQFMLTYGDGVANINLHSLMKHHNNMVKEHGVLGTITTYCPKSRFGIVYERGKLVSAFKEKPQTGNMINVGFMIFEKDIFKIISDANISLEGTEGTNASLLMTLSKQGKLAYYLHEGFWECMDTYRDYVNLNNLWKAGKPWKTWKN